MSISIKAPFIPHLEAIRDGDSNEILAQLKNYIHDEEFLKKVKKLMTNSVRRIWIAEAGQFDLLEFIKD